LNPFATNCEVIPLALLFRLTFFRLFFLDLLPLRLVGCLAPKAAMPSLANKEPKFLKEWNALDTLATAPPNFNLDKMP